jgi:dihydrofolate reductase
MSRVVVSEFITLDGVVQDPGGAEKETFPHGGWSMRYWHDDIGQFKHDELFASDALLLGRVTYQGFAKAWPKMTGTGDFGERMNSLPKFVVSTTLDTVEWNNSHLLKGNVVEEITYLKRQPGQDMLVNGSAQLVQTLTQHNLVDEFRLLVYPVVLGSGKRLFQDRSAGTLTLVESRPYPNGVVLLRYQPSDKSSAQ